MNSVMGRWVTAVTLLGGNRLVAEQAAQELLRCYAQPHRRYHDQEHVRAVLRNAADLAEALELDEVDRALLAVAACAHDVVYDARPGRDEQLSAEWANRWLRRAEVAPKHVTRVERLVLATLDHDADPDDQVASALLDADLAILGSAQDEYDRYAMAVRAEYAFVDDATWTAGRTKVLSKLLSRRPLYRTEQARRRWEAAARRNLTRELGLG